MGQNTIKEKNVRAVAVITARSGSLGVYMAIEIKAGLYEKIGIRVVNDTLFFTFQCKGKSKYALKLYKKGTDEYEIIEMPNQYCIGEVCSLMIKGIDFGKYEYTILEDGEERLGEVADRR